MVLVVLLGIAAVAAVWRLRRGKTGPEVKTGSAANINEDLVAYSSQIICIRRAVESAQENPLFIDPLAAILAGDYKGDGKRSPRISIRTKYFDDFLESAVSTGTAKQIVLPAAGMDSRAYRLLVPEDATTYEIDQKIVVETKEKLIAEATESFVPKCHLKRISADLNDKNWSEKLVEAGFKPSEPSVWLLEGLLYYLTEDQVISLFQTISTLLTEESTLLASLTTGSLRDNRDIDNLDSKRPSTAPPLTSKFKWSCGKPEEFFSLLNFTVVDSVPVGSEKANYGIWDRPDVSTVLYVSMKPRTGN